MRSIIFMVLICAVCGFRTSPDLKADDVLKRMAEKLNTIKTLRYQYNRKISYPSENYKASTSASIFIDFSGTDTLLGFRYQITDAGYSNIFNGTEQFDLNEKDKTIRLQQQPSAKSFRNISYFYNSIITLKRIIPAVLSDETISKTLKEDDKYYTVQLSLNKRMFNYLEGFSNITAERVIHYRIFIDKATLFPRRVIQTNNVNEDLVQTDFSDIETGAPSPPETSWYYSTYAREYKPKEEKVLQPLAVNTMAPDFTLPGLQGNVSLSALRGKVVLLEFWIRNCGYCIAAVPTLNNYPDVFAINVHDTPADIERFAKNNKATYKMLYNGKKVAEQYGIDAYPMMVIVDKAGKVVYVGSVNKTAIDDILKREEAMPPSR
ncbi:TlpA disulfide reductase family protein [Chitinophaga niabensis]|uniref:Peroxiredoxin n=1 Tax=Chitinophaga niabensis TaxID=536979 RepID=A0A1N6DYP5_9BACT|nr:TlpA disulfide reductase family protein [Chitinophaga niabensis]SIN75908.1 Peroxiredoxin [Chitinophaga niabensis]